MKGNILKLLFLICVTFLTFNIVYAEENTEVFKSDNLLSEETVDDAEEIVDEYTYNVITDILSQISKKLIAIDSKLDNARINDDYSRYPFIRLGIDSPYFGLASIIESRLNIKDSVSTIDMAKGYSIRSIVNTKNMLLEDVGVSDFVISTRKVTISNEMLKKDAVKCLYKLINYLQQVRLVNDYTEMQISNIFSDYVSESKEISKSYIRNEINNASKILNEIEENIIEESLINDTKISENLQKYDEYLDKVYNFNKIANGILTTDEELDNLAIEVIQFKTEISNFLNELKVKKSENVNLNTILKNVYILMNEDVTWLENIGISETFFEENEEAGMYGYLSRYVSQLNKYRQDISDKMTLGTYDGQELDFDESKLEIEKNKIFDIYLKFLNSYNTLLNEYIKITVTYIKSDNFENLKLSDELIYIYLELDTSIKDISYNFKKDSIYSNNISVSKFKQIAEKVYSAYCKVIGE